MLTLGYVVAASLAALCCYLAMPHLNFAVAGLHRRMLVVGAIVLAGIAAVLAVSALGPWPGIFATLAAFMCACVLLPYLDAWRGQRRVE